MGEQAINQWFGCFQLGKLATHLTTFEGIVGKRNARIEYVATYVSMYLEKYM